MSIRNASAVWNGTLKEGNGTMYLAAQLTDGGYPPAQIRTSAKVHLEAGPRIALIELDTEAELPDVDEKTFQEKVDYSKANCPISLALQGPELRVSARLV